MIIGSIKEDSKLEKRVSLTPETAKNIIGLGLKVCVEKNYANHLGIDDKEYQNIGVEIKNSSNEVLNESDLIIKVNCPSESEIDSFKDNTILVGMLNPTKNKNRISEIIKKKIKTFSLELLPRITRAQSMDVLSSQSNLAGYRAVIDCVSEFEKAVKSSSMIFLSNQKMIFIIDEFCMIILFLDKFTSLSEFSRSVAIITFSAE